MIGVVGSGAMGSALGAGWLEAGEDVVTCLAGRSDRTRALVAAAGLRTVESPAEVVRADVVVSVVPPGAALDAARAVAAAAQRTGARPLVADLNAVSPATLRRVEGVLADAGLALVDGSISGPPPSAGDRLRVYVSGGDLPAHPWLDVVHLDGPLGTASALKMCTASVYKGSTALVMQAMLTARAHGVLDEFLADTARQWPGNVPGWEQDVALAASKAHRFVGEMQEIARTQAAAGLPAALFDGVAASYARAARTELGRTPPERARTVPNVLDALTLDDALPRGVLFDFSGTLFHIETAAQAVLAALGPDLVGWAPELARLGAINGSTFPAELPDHLADVWERRDLDPDAHRAAYSGLSRHAGLTDTQARTLYDRGVEPDAWHPYPDTVRVLRTLRERRVPVAVVSNIGWDPRPVLARYGVDGDIDVLVLSMQRGVVKPDPEIFRQACADLAVAPEDCVMVGDNPHADGAAARLGIRFVHVPDDPAERAPDALARAVGLTP